MISLTASTASIQAVYLALNTTCLHIHEVQPSQCLNSLIQTLLLFNVNIAELYIPHALKCFYKYSLYLVMLFLNLLSSFLSYCYVSTTSNLNKFLFILIPCTESVITKLQFVCYRALIYFNCKYKL